MELPVPCIAPLQRLGVAPQIVLLDDNEDLRELLEMLLSTRFGVASLSLGSVEELIARANELTEVRVAILDINLGAERPTGLDAYEWLIDHGYNGKIFFLTGHANSHPLVARACETGAQVWTKPFVTHQLFAAIGTLLPASTVQA